MRIFRENLLKLLGKCWENLGKLLRGCTNFLDKFRSKYQSTLRKTEEAFDFV